MFRFAPAPTYGFNLNPVKSGTTSSVQYPFTNLKLDLDEINPSFLAPYPFLYPLPTLSTS